MIKIHMLNMDTLITKDESIDNKYDLYKSLLFDLNIHKIKSSRFLLLK